MRKTLTTLRALCNVKKQVLMALIPALTYSAYAESGLHFDYSDQLDVLSIEGEGDFAEVVQWFQEYAPERGVQMVNTKGATIYFGDGETPATDLPYCSIIQMLQGTTFSFKDLITVEHYPNTDGPMFYTGQFYPESQQGSLNLDVSSHALEEWFSKSVDHSHLMEFTLIDKCMFDNSKGSVTCTFAGLPEGKTYNYGNEHFQNVGIITDEKLLEPNQIALLFKPVGQQQGGFPYGSFSLVAVGSNFEPVVPEPATGTLSLLALAGLSARRRRK